MKKYSWIAALLVALTISVFFVSCGESYVENPDLAKEVTYTDVKLGAMNVWAGGEDKQRGWATLDVGGEFKFLGVGDKLETAKDKGYKQKEFVAATRLEIEIVDEIKGAVEIVWGGSQGSPLGGWHQTKITTDGGVPDASKAKLAGKILTIDLTKLTDYAKFKAADEDVKIIVQYYTGAGVPDLVKSAKLQIPDEVDFVAAKTITLAKNEFYSNGELTLTATVGPKKATNTLIHWAIKSFQEKGAPAADIYTTDKGYNLLTAEDKKDETIVLALYEANRAALLSHVDFIPVEGTYIDQNYLQDDVYPGFGYEEKISYPDGKSEDTIYMPAKEQGTVVVVAIIKDGKAEGEDLIQEFTITVTSPPPINIKVNGVAQSITDYLVFRGDGDLKVLDDSSGFTVSMGSAPGYGATYQFKVDLGAGKQIKNFTTVKLAFQGIDGDTESKQLYLFGKATRFTGYVGVDSSSDTAHMAGTHILARQTGAQKYVGPKTKENITIKIGDGAYNDGWTDGESTADTGAARAGRYTANVNAITTQEVWLTLYIGTGTADTSFTISNVEFE